MIHQNTINQVRELDIVDVIGKHVTLKKQGKDYKGLSPFTNEKTPSFSVNPVKQMFKCFSSGHGGDGISFIEQKFNLSFYEALKHIAQDHAITIEYENESPALKKEREAEQLSRKAVNEVLNYALSWFAYNDLPKSFTKFRSFPEATTSKYKIGYAPGGKRNFYDVAIKAGYSKESLIKAGLVRQTDSGIYDVYQDRIIFPIFDFRGNVIAFTGRTASETPPEAKYQPPKYLNSPDSIWQKGKHLYGLNWSIKEDASPKQIYLVEGQTDLIRMQKHGFTATVCLGGTALTTEQCKLIKRYTDIIVYVPDNDIGKYLESIKKGETPKNPGIEAMHRNATILLENGITVKVLIPGTDKSRTDVDPDSWLRKLHTPEDVANWAKNTEDYITAYLHRECMAIGAASPKDQADQIARMGKTIETIKEYTLRSIYYDEIGTIWSSFKKKFKLKAPEKTVKLPELEKLEKNEQTDYFDFGFWEKNNAYYSVGSNGKETRFTTFKMDVLYFVYSENDPVYICLFTHMFGKKRIRAISTDDLTGIGPFKKVLGKMGPFVFEGTDHHLNKLKIKYLYGVKEASSPQYMGYNVSGGFYTWSNGLYNGSFNKADKYGIVQLTKKIASIEQFRKLSPESHILLKDKMFVLYTAEDFIKEQTESVINKYIEAGAAKQLGYYYLPYADKLKKPIDGEDYYEFQRRFKHFETGITFNLWAKLMVEVYGDNGKVGILFYIMSLFRDVIFKANNSWVPILGLFGTRQSGKSTMARSLCYMFGIPLEDGINLESGSTTTGIGRVLASSQNAIIWLNEYKNSLPSYKLGLIKGIADGSGKLTGVKTSGTETKNYKPLSTAVLCGQDLPTQDPALFSRNVICEFDGKKRNYESFKQLTDIEKTNQTTTVTCELLKYRKQIKANYALMEPEVTKSLRENLENDGISKDQIDDRMLLNYSSLLTPFHILIDTSTNTGLEFPFTMKEMMELFIEKARFQSEIQSTSDDVEQYLSVVASLVNKEIFEGTHYKIEVQLNGPTLLYIRMQQIHPLYRAAANRSSMNAYDASTIKQYLKKHAVYVEHKKSVRFTQLKNPTSAVILDYDRLREMEIDFYTQTELT